MPSSLTGLLIFIALLAPGLTYSAYRSASKPAEKPTALRELGGIALRSLVFNALALIAFAIVHQLRSAWTPDVGRLIRGNDDYLRLQYDSLLWWGFGLLLFACAVGPVAASVIGSTWWSNLVAIKPISWMTPSGGVTSESAWWGLFNAFPGSKVYVECFLTDQGYLSGWLLSYSPDSDETENRELVLTEPSYRGPDADDTTPLRVGAVAVSARRIQYLSVSYLADVPVDPETIDPA